MQKITIKSNINADIKKVWEYWNKPEHITKWAFASDDWSAPSAENDLRVGGKFKTRMQAKDGSAGFDFGGTYTKVKNYELIEYDMYDRQTRHVKVGFAETPDGIQITNTFDSEDENPVERQRAGWLAILNNFKKYIEEN